MKSTYRENLSVATTFTKMLRFWAIAFVLSGLFVDTYTQAIDLNEAICQPRPVVVAIDPESHNFKPYQVILHRCQGTCDNHAPNVKGCIPKSQKELTLTILDINRKVITTIKVTNETSCQCGCASRCDSSSMYPDENCRCKCFPGMTCSPSLGPRVKEATNSEKNPIPIPYLVGMALVGFFAVFVLLFDAILCSKKKGLMYNVRNTCKGSQAPQESNSNGMKRSETIV